jgi:hypothetical protein
MVSFFSSDELELFKLLTIPIDGFYFRPRGV